MLNSLNIDGVKSEWQFNRIKRHDVDWYIALGNQAIKLGHPSFAFDILNEGHKAFADNFQIRYLSALALAKSGSTGMATNIATALLDELSESDSLYSDTLSLAGRLEKDRWMKLPDGYERQVSGRKSCEYYQRAFESSHEYFPGINAATLSALTGRHEDAQRIAGEVRSICTRKVEVVSCDDYWCEATLGEVAVLLDDREAAFSWYRKAVAHAERNFGDIASMRRQLKLLSNKYDLANELLIHVPNPKVVVFSGHMIDRQNSSPARFPAHIESNVRDAIEKTIFENNVGIGYCSAACGSDILFIECMLKFGAEVNIVLPFKREDFVSTSVAFAGFHWIERFDRALSSASSVSYCVQEDYCGDEVIFEHAESLVQGLAILRAEQLETDVAMLAVADPIGTVKAGGTADNLMNWQGSGRNAIVINLSEIRDKVPILPSHSEKYIHSEEVSAKPELTKTVFSERQICTMLFADIVGYSQLREHETPIFFINFLNTVSRVVDTIDVKPIFQNTWGDGLYFVFESVEDAAEFALRLRDSFASSKLEMVDWFKSMNIRMGMHTGPVFKAFDPIIKLDNYFGSHVTLAARIEPIATPGSIFISEQMAAVLAASSKDRFAYDYQGQHALPKGQGTLNTYRLRRMFEED